MPRRPNAPTCIWMPSWNPTNALGLQRVFISQVNQENFTCVGIAIRQKRPCQYSISECDSQAAIHLTRTLTERSLRPETLNEDLRTLANNLLCEESHRIRARPDGKKNRDQGDEVVERWRQAIAVENARQLAAFNQRHGLAVS